MLGTTDIYAIGDGTVTNALSTLNSNLENDYIKKNGSSYGCFPTADVNDFLTGVGLFNESNLNVPSSDWWLIVAGGGDGTVTPVAFNLANNKTPKIRCCAAATWCEWQDLKLS